MSTLSQRSLTSSVLLACLTLAACGGGDGTPAVEPQSNDGLRQSEQVTSVSKAATNATDPESNLATAGTEAAQNPNSCLTGAEPTTPPLQEGKIVKPWATTAKPQRGLNYVDPNWGTCILRVTDFTADGLVGFARNDYSRRQAFNADNSRQIVYSYNGSWHLYDTATSQRVSPPAGMPGLAADAEPQWHPNNPNFLFYLPNLGIGMKLYRYDVRNNTSIVRADFSSRLKAVWPQANAAWTKSEGSPSADGRYWCFMVDDTNWNGLGIFTWDKNTDTIIATRSVTERPDHVSMSPSGNYCVVSGGSGVVAYSRDLRTTKTVTTAGEHSDIGLDANGDDMYVSVDYSAGQVYIKNIRTGARTDLFSAYGDGTATAFHFSAKSFDKPGWFVMSTYADYTTRPPYVQQWMHRKVVAVEMKASPRIYNIADTRVTDNSYWTEPHASTNRDLSRVTWTSNWNQKTDQVDTYTSHLWSPIP